MGRHNGLPASIIVTTRIAELEAAAGQGLTGDGTVLPISDVIRLAPHARHYPVAFDKGKALRLYHSKRLASPGQRIVLSAKERGCSAPAARPVVTPRATSDPTVIPHAQSPSTDVNQLTFALRRPPPREPTTAGAPAKAPTATPNGSLRPISSAANPARTRFIMPKAPPRRRSCGLTVIAQMAKLCHREGNLRQSRCATRIPPEPRWKPAGAAIPGTTGYPLCPR
nr:DUF222 domain-containing protein [Mycobacterium attenuatum]